MPTTTVTKSYQHEEYGCANTYPSRQKKNNNNNKITAASKIKTTTTALTMSQAIDGKQNNKPRVKSGSKMCVKQQQNKKAATTTTHLHKNKINPFLQKKKKRKATKQTLYNVVGVCVTLLFHHPHGPMYTLPRFLCQQKCCCASN